MDRRLYAEDIAGSVAHARMLAKQGIITAEDAGRIEEGLLGILKDIEGGAFVFDASDEDVHMAIEAELTRRIGDAGKRLHTARSRNDQVATDTRLHAKREALRLHGAIGELRRVLARSRRCACRRGDARLHAPAEGAAGALRAPHARVLVDAHPRREAR